MIGVGINENVILDKVEIADKDKGTLVFHWREARDVDAVPVSGFDALNNDGYAETGNGDSLSIRLFGPLAPFAETTMGTPISAVDQQKQATDSIGEKKNILFQILNVYMTTEKCKLDVYRNTGLTMENFGSRITQLGTLEKIMSNLAEDFVRLITPFLSNDALLVRLLLVKRKGTEFPDFRQRFVKDNPFIEDGRIPLASSKLKFTKHEITKGLHDATPTAQTAADIAEDKEEAHSADSVFGAQ